jgi:hypothetical protein
MDVDAVVMAADREFNHPRDAENNVLDVSADAFQRGMK